MNVTWIFVNIFVEQSTTSRHNLSKMFTKNKWTNILHILQDLFVNLECNHPINFIKVQTKNSWPNRRSQTFLMRCESHSNECVGNVDAKKCKICETSAMYQNKSISMMKQEKKFRKMKKKDLQFIRTHMHRRCYIRREKKWPSKNPWNPTPLACVRTHMIESKKKCQDSTKLDEKWCIKGRISMGYI